MINKYKKTNKNYNKKHKIKNICICINDPVNHGGKLLQL